MPQKRQGQGRGSAEVQRTSGRVKGNVSYECKFWLKMVSASWCHTENVEPWFEGFGSKGVNPVPPNSPPGFLFVRVLGVLLVGLGNIILGQLLGLIFWFLFPLGCPPYRVRKQKIPQKAKKILPQRAPTPSSLYSSTNRAFSISSLVQFCFG